MGRAKAAVLPLPVIAEARRSRPSRAGGIACFWMGVGRSNPRVRTPRWSSGFRPKTEKGIEVVCVLFWSGLLY